MSAVMEGKSRAFMSVFLILLCCEPASAYHFVRITNKATTLFGQAARANAQAGLRDVHFQKLLSGRAVMKGADNVDFSNYKATDGALLQYRLESYHSASQAKARLDALVKTAQRLTERNPKLDEDGKVIGDRAVLISKESKAIVVWNLGTKVHVIESSKLDHALEFERQLLQEGGVRRPGGAP